ncbi:MAG TPA: hypothetical protein PKA88_18370 [Polyangiaceae bacterium]|nr:hypothetical protein [Polyangiaceae bacterium]
MLIREDGSHILEGEPLGGEVPKVRVQYSPKGLGDRQDFLDLQFYKPDGSLSIERHWLMCTVQALSPLHMREHFLEGQVGGQVRRSIDLPPGFAFDLPVETSRAELCVISNSGSDSTATLVCSCPLVTGTIQAKLYLPLQERGATYQWFAVRDVDVRVTAPRSVQPSSIALAMQAGQQLERKLSLQGAADVVTGTPQVRFDPEPEPTSLKLICDGGLSDITLRVTASAPCLYVGTMFLRADVSESYEVACPLTVHVQGAH